MNDNYFHVHDAIYAYKVYGQGEPVVLLHGFTGSSMTWNDFIFDWSKKFQVITIDLPGHGRSTSESPRTMESFCDDLAKLLKRLKIKKCHIVGYSMGGRAALSFARYYPDYVKTLILESASPGLRTEKERSARIKSDRLLAERIMTNGIEDFVCFWENIPLFHSQKKLPKEVQAVIRKERLSHTEKGLANSLIFMGTGAQPSWWDALSLIKMPVLLIAGNEDTKFVELNKEMKLHLPNAQLTIVKNASHVVHVEQVEKFAKIVMEYIEKHT